MFVHDKAVYIAYRGSSISRDPSASNCYVGDHMTLQRYPRDVLSLDGDTSSSNNGSPSALPPPSCFEQLELFGDHHASVRAWGLPVDSWPASVCVARERRIVRVHTRMCASVLAAMCLC
jgi:hypothetical protein